jgi:hypothetical protein
MTARITGLCLLVASVCAAAAAGPIGMLGIALTPRNFPKHNADDVREMFDVASDIGGAAVFIYQWSQPDLHRVAADMIAMSRQHKLTPIVAISPTVLGGARGAFDVPQELKGRRGKVSFDEKNVYERFIKDAAELAKLKPPYLCLATEINFLALADLKQYLTFAHVYKRLYPELKKISRDTKIFVSFQWDLMRMMDQKEPHRVKEFSNVIDVFRPELDAVAFTTYPADHFATPADMPADYYAHVFDHVKRSDEIIFMEIGWPTTGKGSESEQAAFIARLPLLMEEVKPGIVAWSLLHDVRQSGLSGELAATGLIEPGGRRKPAFETFRKLGKR